MAKLSNLILIQLISFLVQFRQKLKSSKRFQLLKKSSDGNILVFVYHEKVIRENVNELIRFYLECDD